MRLDAYLVASHMVGGRDRAKELIAEGKVRVDGRLCVKPSTETDGKTVTLLQEESFVGRGAYKLQKAWEEFSVALSGEVCLDAGASTGGFTQWMLTHGASRVYAVDVGSGQLAEPLLKDERCINLEKTDIRTLELPEKPTFFTADVSFISLTQILPALRSLTGERASGVCLIKPQFEAGRAFVGKKGVVRDRFVHADVIGKIVRAARENGFFAAGLTYSPITGQNGNIEYLIYLKKEDNGITVDPEKAVRKAWEALK